VRRSLITATAATSLMGCFLMGAVANLPLAIAPGMGINAYFAYSIVGYMVRPPAAGARARAGVVCARAEAWARTGGRGAQLPTYNTLLQQVPSPPPSPSGPALSCPPPPPPKKT
jgi:hypothetical protein